MTTENPIENDVRIRQALAKAEQRDEVIGLAIGAGSMAWSETPTGEFDSDYASRIVAATSARLAELPDLASALRDAQDRVYAANEANGWFEDDRTVGDDIALLHSEASEMLEAYRDGGLADQTKEVEHHDLGAGVAGVTILPKPEGFGSEAADVFIRLLDTCKRRGVDLAFEFERKLSWNQARGHRHGGKNL